MGAVQRLTIPGVDWITASSLIAEIGGAVNQFPTAQHLASWAGICPGNEEGAGKRHSGKTRKGSRWLRRVLCQAAWAASHTKNTYLAAQFRRLAARRGKQRAIVAVATASWLQRFISCSGTNLIGSGRQLLRTEGSDGSAALSGQKARASGTQSHPGAWRPVACPTKMMLSQMSERRCGLKVLPGVYLVKIVGEGYLLDSGNPNM
jgi:hypothetical protein